MELKLVLGENRLVRIPEAIIAEEKENVLIKLESSIYDLGKVAVTIKNGFKQKSKIVKTGYIDITEFCERACKIDIKVDLIAQGYNIKSWYLEPILVREIDKKFELIPEIHAMEERLEILSKDMDKVKKYLFDIV